jgi:hypothetical protein
VSLLNQDTIIVLIVRFPRLMPSDTKRHEVNKIMYFNANLKLLKCLSAISGAVSFDKQ